MIFLGQLELISDVVVAAAIGGATAALINLIGGFAVRHLESKRLVRELAIRIAFESWQKDTTTKTDLIKAGHTGKDLTILPPDSFVAKTLWLVEIAADTRLTAQEIYKKIHKDDPTA